MSQSPHTSPQMSTGKKAGLIGLAVVLLIAATAMMTNLLVRDHDTKSSPKPQPSASTSGPSQPDGPNGCVGGTDTSTAISTAFQEPLTERGAIQFTGTVLRWIYDTRTQQSQLDNVGGRLADKKILGYFKGNSEGVPAGGHAGYSTKNSQAWVKNFDAKKGTATVLFTGKQFAYVGNEGKETENATVVELTKKDDHWFVASTGGDSYGKGTDGVNKIQSEINKHGTPLAGGCGE